MYRLFVLLTILIVVASSASAGTSKPKELKDLYFGEALYYAFQGDWFDAIARLDTELMQHHGVDEPELDTLHYHINQAEFDVGDFELSYRMHQRAGRAITAVIEGSVEEPVRNEALFRLARMCRPLAGARRTGYTGSSEARPRTARVARLADLPGPA